MLTFTYCCFAALCGWLEALLYARRGAESFSGNEHVGMTLQRIAAVLLVPLSMLAYAWHGWWLSAELLPAALLFPACHDEAYNFTRLWLSFRAQMASDYERADSISWKLAWQQYHYGYQSPTTTARNDFTGEQRTWLAGLGLILLLALYLFLHFHS